MSQVGQPQFIPACDIDFQKAVRRASDWLPVIGVCYVIIVNWTIECGLHRRGSLFQQPGGHIRAWQIKCCAPPSIPVSSHCAHTSWLEHCPAGLSSSSFTPGRIRPGKGRLSGGGSGPLAVVSSRRCTVGIWGCCVHKQSWV
jgi:hypothetical protein